MNIAILQALALGANFISIGGYQVVDLGVKHPFFSGIMENPKEDEDINAVVKETFSVLDRSFMWMCDRPLKEAKNVYPFPEMELDLDYLMEPKPTSAELFILSSEDLGEWKEVVGPIYDFEDDDIDAFAELYRGKEEFFHIVAKVNDVAVGAGTLQIYKDVALLHNITTLPKARGKGIGSRISFELLLLAKRLHCKRSVIHGSEKAESMYKKLGYKTKKIAYANFFVKSSV